MMLLLNIVDNKKYHIQILFLYVQDIISGLSDFNFILVVVVLRSSGRIQIVCEILLSQYDCSVFEIDYYAIDNACQLTIADNPR